MNLKISSFGYLHKFVHSTDLKNIYSAERFQKDAVSVSGFTGFVWTKVDLHKNIYSFKNIRIRVDEVLESKVSGSNNSFNMQVEISGN